MDRSLTVAVPALNEERNIQGTIEAVRAAAARAPGLEVEILVVDDGSRDRTPAIVEQLAREYGGIRLLRNPSNLGLGASLRRAIGEARTQKIVFIPGDNDIPVYTLELMFRNAFFADVVMIYFLNDEMRGRKRYLVSTLFRLIYTTLFDLYVVYINGPAVYPVAALQALDLRSTRFSIVAEINVKLLRQGLSFAEFASARQVGMEGSTSSPLRGLSEAARVMGHLIWTVHFQERPKFSRRPTRVSQHCVDAVA